MAGGFAPCDLPFVFEGAAANVVPIEYLATVADSALGDDNQLATLQVTAQRLAWLMKLDTWHQPTYGSLGVVAHMFSSGVCDPDEVLRLLLEGRAAAPIRPGQILVMLQGRIFIEGETIFLQSRLRGFRRSDATPTGDAPLSINFFRESVGTVLADREFGAGLPPIDITFAPRALTMAELDQIDLVSADASQIHEQPTESSPL